MASQNGRFILRGRYGRGPVKFNLSKSGLSDSLASDFGRLNLTNPGRSSAKLFGVQLRGRKAALVNAVALLVAGIVALVQVMGIVLIVAAKALAWLLAAVIEGTHTVLSRWQAARSERAFESRFAELEACTHTLLRSKYRARELRALAEPIELGSENTANMDADRRQTWSLLAARSLFETKDSDRVLELFLSLDNLCRAVGDKSESQEELLALIVEVGRIRLNLAQVGVGSPAQGEKRLPPPST